MIPDASEIFMSLKEFFYLQSVVVEKLDELLWILSYSKALLPCEAFGIKIIGLPEPSCLDK